MLTRMTFAAIAVLALTVPASANGKSYQRYVGVEAQPVYEPVYYERQPIIAFSLGGLGFYEPYTYGLDYYDDDDYFSPRFFRGRHFHRHHHFGGHRHRGHFGGHHFHRGGFGHHRGGRGRR